MSKYNDLAKKLYELANRGEGGEKENAKDMLDKLMEKHGMTLEDLEGDIRKKTWFKIKKSDTSLFLQIAASVDNEQDFTFWHSQDNGYEIAIEITPGFAIEIEQKFHFYSNLLKKEIKAVKELAYAAFIQKHRLFRKNSVKKDAKSEDKISLRDMSKLINMMDTLSDVRFQKQIEEKKDRQM